MLIDFRGNNSGHEKRNVELQGVLYHERNALPCVVGPWQRVQNLHCRDTGAGQCAQFGTWDVEGSLGYKTALIGDSRFCSHLTAAVGMRLALIPPCKPLPKWLCHRLAWFRLSCHAVLQYFRQRTTFATLFFHACLSVIPVRDKPIRRDIYRTISVSFARRDRQPVVGRDMNKL